MGIRLPLLVVCVLSVLTAASCRTSSLREVTLLTRGMTFELPGQPDTPNPVLRFQRGERVRLVLKNEAAGMVHDLAIPAWNVALDAIAAGQSTEMILTVPDDTGQVEYRCRPHAAMMSGVIDVTP